MRMYDAASHGRGALVSRVNASRLELSALGVKLRCRYLEKEAFGALLGSGRLWPGCGGRPPVSKMLEHFWAPDRLGPGG